MANIDKRFALIRNGEPWYAAQIKEKGAESVPTFRISARGKSRDAHGQAEKITDIEQVAKMVLLEGMRMRCAPEGGRSQFLR